jgi:DNA-directed RNA polymerase specialized sigma24 family protein
MRTGGSAAIGNCASRLSKELTEPTGSSQFVLEFRRQTIHARCVRGSADVESPGALTRFVTTRWNLIRLRHPPGASSQVDPGLAELCHIYWRPIFTYIYRWGYSEHDAQDLTQDFFLMIMEGNLLQFADPNRGRFRSLLLQSLKNFLIDAADKRRRHKRGGQVRFVSWEKWMAEAPAQLSLSRAKIESSPPEALFDAGWAAAIAGEALRRLRLECESKGRRRVYQVLQTYLTADRGEVCYEKLSRALAVPESSVKSLLHHFRKRYRELLREEIAKTVESEANVDEEIRYLCATLSAEA